MKSVRDESNWSVVVGLVVLACASRCISPLILSQPSNFAPMTAIALFSGARFKDKSSALFIPLLIILISDAVVNGALYGNVSPFYDGFYWQYAAYILVAMLGRSFSSVQSLSPLLGLGVTSSAIFFVVSNLGVWLVAGIYEHTLSGLILCFTMALPFLKGSLASDLLFSLALFGLYQVITSERTVMVGSEQKTVAA